MRKFAILLFGMLALSLVFCGCNDDTYSDVSSMEADNSSTEEVAMGEICSEGQYYVVFRGTHDEQWMHYYAIKDENGETVKVVPTWMDEAKISEMEGGLLKISLQTGMDESEIKTSYYDLPTGKSSPDRYYVLAEKNGLVAYVSKGSVVISEMFYDKTVKTIALSDFDEESEITASFSDNGSEIDVTVDSKTKTYSVK